MNSKKITDTEIADLKISALPTRPNAAAKYGGYGYSAADMKAAFDRLPLFIIERFNALIDDIGLAEGGITDSVKTGITSTHTLRELFSDIENGAFAAYLMLLDKSLAEHIQEIRERLDALEARGDV